MGTSPSQALLRFFDYSRLHPAQKAVAQPFSELAHRIEQNIPDGAEKTACLRKLLEAKDCAVRASLGMA